MANFVRVIWVPFRAFFNTTEICCAFPSDCRVMLRSGYFCYTVITCLSVWILYRPHPHLFWDKWLSQNNHFPWVLTPLIIYPWILYIPTDICWGRACISVLVFDPGSIDKSSLALFRANRSLSKIIANLLTTAPPLRHRLKSAVLYATF